MPTRRECLLGGAASLGGLFAVAPPSLAALWSNPQKAFVDAVQGAMPFDNQGFVGKSSLDAAFQKALAVQDDPIALEAAWTECLRIAPNNAAVLSNRGTVRLLLKKYTQALEDLEKARELEVAAYGYSSGLVMVPLGNAKGALGDWQGAISSYEEALEDPYPGMASLALASSALAKFELGQSAEAISAARAALKEDPDSADVTKALAVMLWAVEDKKGAATACAASGGAQALKDFAESDQVASTWPPRMIAATSEFISACASGLV